MAATSTTPLVAKTLSMLLSLPASDVALFLQHASSLLAEPSLDQLELRPRGAHLQLFFRFARRSGRSSRRVVEERSSWRAGKRDGWCQQTYTDEVGHTVSETVFYAAGEERGCRLWKGWRRGAETVMLVENGAEMPVEQCELGVVFEVNTASVPLRYYIVFGDGVRRISDNNGPDRSYLALLNGEGARRIAAAK